MARFPIRMDSVWRAVLIPFGATKSRAFVEVTDAQVHFRFGLMFDQTVPRGEIQDAFRRPWPIWMGIGWRSNLRGLIGLIGSYEGVVEIKLATKSRAWGVFPCDRIAVSLEDPDVFISALGFKTTSESAAQPPPASEPEPRAPKAVPETPSAEAAKPARATAPRATKKTAAVKKPVAKRGTTRKRRGE